MCKWNYTCDYNVTVKGRVRGRWLISYVRKAKVVDVRLGRASLRRAVLHKKKKRNEPFDVLSVSS